MDFSDVARNCGWLEPREDPLFTAFLRMRVWSVDVTARAFKLRALTDLRQSALYKRFRLKPAVVAAVERTLLEAYLTPLALFLMCALYGVSLVVLEKRLFYKCGDAPVYGWRNGKLGRVDSWGLFELHPIKPLYAVSYYSLGQLKDMAAQLRVTGDTKAQLYAAISSAIE